jgi:hypothetical protein
MLQLLYVKNNAGGGALEAVVCDNFDHVNFVRTRGGGSRRR